MDGGGRQETTRGRPSGGPLSRRYLLRPAHSFNFICATLRLRSGQDQRLAPHRELDIDVTLDPSTRSITGSELITWHNQGVVAAYSIRLHLYWNAFRNTNSTWLKQRHLAGDDPFAAAAADDCGYTYVT